MLPEDQTFNRLIHGVPLMANANIEVNIRHKEAMKPEFHTRNSFLSLPQIDTGFSFPSRLSSGYTSILQPTP